jgi:hypothetical protein
VESALRNARKEGQITGTYIVLNTQHDPGEVVDRALNACGAEAENLNFAALDIEMFLGDKTEAIHAVEKGIQRLLRRGQRPAIYTAYWAWTQFLYNTTEFRHVPLIYALYNEAASLPLPNPRFGGWDFPQVIGHQYTGSKVVNFAGTNITIDWNVFDKKWIEEGEIMTQEILDAIAKLEEGIKTIQRRLFYDAVSGVRAGAIDALADYVASGQIPPKEVINDVKDYLASLEN